MKTLLLLTVLAVEVRSLRLTDNGYDGLVVSVGGHVPQDQCDGLIRGLKVNYILFNYYFPIIMVIVLANARH